MADYFDVVVVGSGAAASQIAQNCRTAGKSVAMVDSKPFGGTCALRGCDPKKVLVGAADAVDWVARMKGRGVAGDAHIQWRDLMAFKHTFTDPVPRQRQESFAKQGIEAIRGRARFLSPARIAIESRESVTPGRSPLPPGRKPARLGIPGESLLIDSEQFLNLDELPPRIIFVGGGYIAFEFAHIAARAGGESNHSPSGPARAEGASIPILRKGWWQEPGESGIRYPAECASDPNRAGYGLCRSSWIRRRPGRPRRRAGAGYRGSRSPRGQRRFRCGRHHG